MLSSILYQKDAKGGLRFWQIELNPFNHSQYRTISGILGTNNPIVSNWTQAKVTNSGRSNERTPLDQAIFEIQAEITKKLDRKYYKTIEEAKVAKVTHKFYAPMLAHKFDRVKYTKQGEPPVYVQPKLDGIRCIASIDGLHSRQGKLITSCPHIYDQLKPLFDHDPDLVLDGELYNHELKDDFNKLASIIRTSKGIDTERVIQYHIYDIPSELACYEDRFGTLKNIIPKDNLHLILVETILSGLYNQIECLYAKLMEQGYEGAMIRYPTSPYTAGTRSNNLLKLKEFQDAEFELLFIEEGDGNWKGHAKSACVRLRNGTTQWAGIKGSKEFTKQLLTNTKKYQTVTIRYQNKTPDGKLRFPIVVDWHENKVSAGRQD